MSEIDSLPDNYQALLDSLSSAYLQGQNQTYYAINRQLVETYWQIGRYIVEYEQQGHKRAIYGKALLEALSNDLTLRHGRGFSRSNLTRMRQFYVLYPNCATASHNLTWSHWVELLKIDDDMERNFYLQQSQIEKWSLRELKRQKSSSLFLRLAASKDKKAILALAQKGQLVKKPSDLLRDSYVFEFLKIPEPYHISENNLESLLCDHLQPFLLELGKGFTFVGRQYRITLNNTHYKVDLVFYHRILRCFVLIDLKLGDVEHYDIGQMNMYLGYFAKEENIKGDNPPIGIILSRNKDELLVEYATYNLNSQLFVQKYQLYLPDRESLKKEIELALQEAEGEK
ncbi:PDDEXK nuclease domain-containing protein [Cysteiniphilum sp. QT6929]|uniref:PDDEXK nuclease domain-containing protein n=1 Tax=Cysteiniphilum sp. QT6929 TaxID=2975055 RepID=UPI0024B37FAC|nr:PDDEXK nuclease domain-containing protein [Cysteiniphilum sp. QT6929]WHN65651.1 PDDEXK nuclease domain-containing protein [Cysteiniphilum sp. QT6929]